MPNVRDFGVQSNVYQTPNKAIESFNVSGYFGFGAFADSVFARSTFDWYDTVRWVKGRHNPAFGGSDFLTGRLRSFTQGWGSFQRDRNILFSLFVQDTYKASSRLTLNYGLRFEPSFPWHDLYNQAEAFSPSLYTQGVRSKVYTNAYPGEIFTGDDGSCRRPC